MFGKSKQEAPKGDAGAASKSVNFEISIADMARRSEKRAWMVAMAALLMSLILAGGYFYMLPLKKIEPYMIMADGYTGETSVAKLTGDFSFKSISTQEAVQKSNVTHYVVARESFDYLTTSTRDWDFVHLMSEGAVAQSYTELHHHTNPQAPSNIFGRDKALRVEVVSVSLRTRGTAEKPIFEAEVRFQRSLYDKRTGQTRLLDNKRAAMEFVYNSNLAMTDAQRVDNPLGFRVTSYRVDNDASESPVVAPPSSILPPDAAAQFGLGQAPGQLLPGQTLPGQPLPGQALPSQAVPGQTVPGQVVPGQGVPGQPGQPIPGQPGAVQTVPSQQQVAPAPQFGAPAGAQPVAQPQSPPPQAQPTAQPVR
jgi:type IV secretion system protein VirB8